MPTSPRLGSFYGVKSSQLFNTKALRKVFSDGNSVEFFKSVVARKVFDVDFFTDVHFSAVFSPDVPHDLLFTDRLCTFAG